MLSVSAWYVLKKRNIDLAKSNLKLALPVFILFAFANLFVFGPQHGHRGDPQPATQAGVDGGAVAEHLVRADVLPGLGGRGDPDHQRHLTSHAC